MKSISRIALGAVVAFGLAGGAMSTAAQAQMSGGMDLPSGGKSKAKKGKEPAAPAGPKLSKPVQKLVFEAQTAQGAGDHATAVAKLREAWALPKRTSEDNYYVSAIMINSAQALKDDALLSQSVEGAVEAGFWPANVPTDQRRNFIVVLRSLALKRNDHPTAIKWAQRVVQENPNDPKAHTELAAVYQIAKQPQQAVAALQAGVAAAKAAGQVAPEETYKQIAKLTLDNRMSAQFTTSSLDWLAAYPTPTNWRTVLSLFSDSARFDDQGSLDVYRLMHAQGALASEKDYYEYAETANRRGLPGEAKVIIDEGLAKKMLSVSKPYTKELQTVVMPKVARDKAALPALEREARASANGRSAMSTADAYLSHGNYAKAAEMYKLAIEKGSLDRPAAQGRAGDAPGSGIAIANTRLGIALAKSGDKTGAQAAFNAVQGGPRQQLAQYWLVWLNRA